MNAESHIVKRDVTKTECPWLSEDVVKGTVVYEYHGCAYGCISHTGRAVSLEPNKQPFFELPCDALGVPTLYECYQSVAVGGANENE